MVKNKKIPVPLFLLMVLFLLPMLISFILYHYHEQFRFKTSNYGTLVNPVIPLQEMLNEKKWKILYVPAACSGNQFEKIFFTLHQLKKALGKDSDRVNLVLAIDNRCHLKEYPEFHKRVFSMREYSELEKQIKTAVTNKIYLIDPANNLFMYYPGMVNPVFILKDIKRVLDVSQVG